MIYVKNLISDLKESVIWNISPSDVKIVLCFKFVKVSIEFWIPDVQCGLFWTPLYFN